jgi:Flp pilus assembly protein TadG
MMPAAHRFRFSSRSVAAARGRRLLARGVTALEFAMVAPLAVLVLFFSLEMGIVSWVDASLEVTASRVSRIGQLGVPEGTDCTTAVRKVFEEGVGMWVSTESDLRVYVNTYSPGASNDLPDVNDPAYVPVCNAGTRGDMVIYRLGFKRPGFSGIMGWLGIQVLRFERTVIIQNEP